MNYIIAGTPRSGTGFIARLMTSAGVPIGHEMFFGMPGHGYYPQNAQGDSSWMAVPYIQNFKEATKIHIVRNPLDNLTSLVNIKTFSKDRNIYSEFKKFTMPTLENYKDREKYLAFYIMWNVQIDVVEDIKVKLEDIAVEPKPFLDKLNIKYDESKLNMKKYNASLSRIPKLTLDYFKDCNPDMVTKLISLAKDYGYKIN